MIRTATISALIVILFASNAFSSFSKYDYPYESDSVIAPIQIKDQGIYNIVISIQFLNQPYDSKIYKSDSYESFMRRLKVEWSRVALLHVLQAKEQSINDLANLKSIIEAEVTKLAEQLKQKYSLPKDTEVVFGLTHFFIVEPKNK